MGSIDDIWDFLDLSRYIEYNFEALKQPILAKICSNVSILSNK